MSDSGDVKQLKAQFARLSVRELEGAMNNAVLMYNQFARARDRQGIDSVNTCMELIRAELRRR